MTGAEIVDTIAKLSNQGQRLLPQLESLRNEYVVLAELEVEARRVLRLSEDDLELKLSEAVVQANWIAKEQRKGPLAGVAATSKLFGEAVNVVKGEALKNGAGPLAKRAEIARQELEEIQANKDAIHKQLKAISIEASLITATLGAVSGVELENKEN